MSEAADATVKSWREGRWRVPRLIVALGVLVLVLAACANKEGTAGQETGASDIEDRPTIQMGSSGEDATSEPGDDGTDLPPRYVVNTVDDVHPDGSVSMVAYGIEPTAHMDALMEGKLALSGECPGVDSSGGGEFISVVWPYEYSMDVKGETAQLLDENGDVVASEGEMIYMGGGNSPDPGDTMEAIAPEDCIADSYWMAGSEVQLVADRGQGAEKTPTPASDSGNDVQSEDEALEQDARMYAEAHDVSLEEAKRRPELQQLPGPLQQTLMENEAERFGGLYIEHKPEFRVVVLMTDGDEVTVRSYIDNPELDEIVEVETAEASYRELEHAQQEALEIVEDFGFMMSAGVNVTENRVEIYVSDRAMLEDALEANGQELPEHVVIAGGEAEPETPDED